MKTRCTLLLLLILSKGFCQIPLPPERSDIIWGINGGIVTGENYRTNKSPISMGSTNYQNYMSNRHGQFFDYLNDLNVEYYRTLTPLNTSGIVYDSWYDVEPFLFKSGIDAAKARGVKILPDISMNWDLMSSKTPTQIYHLAYSMGVQFATDYGADIDLYGLTNEMAKVARVSGHGTKALDYDIPKVQKVSAYISGLNNGIKSIDPSASTIVTFQGYQIGFPMALKQYPPLIDIHQNNNFTLVHCAFDMIGINWYSNDTDITSLAYTIGDLPAGTNMLQNHLNVWDGIKNIMITEINIRSVRNGNNNYKYHIHSNSNANSGDMKQWYRKNITNLYKHPKVKGIFIFSLMEDMFLLNYDPNFLNWELYHGVLGCINDDNYCTQGFYPKETFNALKYLIEECKYGYEDYVQALYIDLNCEVGDATGKQHWEQFLRNQPKEPYTKNNFLSWFLNERYASLFVGHLFVNLLDRSVMPTPSQVTFQTNQMKNGRTWEEMITDFCVGEEFWSKAGGGNANFVQRLCWKLHGTTIQSFYTSYVNRLNQYSIGTQAHHHEKVLIIKEFLRSKNYVENFINWAYKDILHKEADTYHWHHYMYNNNALQKDMVISFLNSDEYFKNAVIRGYERRHNYKTWHIVNVNPIPVPSNNLDGSFLGNTYYPPLTPPYYKFFINNPYCIENFYYNSNTKPNEHLYRSAQNLLEESSYNHDEQFSIEISPNPFSGAVCIRSHSFITQPTKVSILNSHGIPIRTLNSLLSNNNSEVIWDGKDDKNNEVPDGLYIISLPELNKQYKTIKQNH